MTLDGGRGAERMVVVMAVSTDMNGDSGDLFDTADRGVCVGLEYRRRRRRLQRSVWCQIDDA